MPPFRSRLPRIDPESTQGLDLRRVAKRTAPASDEGFLHGLTRAPAPLPLHEERGETAEALRRATDDREPTGPR